MHTELWRQTEFHPPQWQARHSEPNRAKPGRSSLGSHPRVGFPPRADPGPGLGFGSALSTSARSDVIARASRTTAESSQCSAGSVNAHPGCAVGGRGRDGGWRPSAAVRPGAGGPGSGIRCPRSVQPHQLCDSEPVTEPLLVSLSVK